MDSIAGMLVFIGIYLGGFFINLIGGLVSMKIWYNDKKECWWSEGLFLFPPENNHIRKPNPNLEEQLKKVRLIVRNTVKGSFLWPISLGIFTILFLFAAIFFSGEFIVKKLFQNPYNSFVESIVYKGKDIKVLKDSKSYRDTPPEYTERVY